MSLVYYIITGLLIMDEEMHSICVATTAIIKFVLVLLLCVVTLSILLQWCSVILCCERHV